MVHDCYTHEKDQAPYALCDWYVFLHVSVSHLSICTSCLHFSFFLLKDTVCAVIMVDVAA